MTLSQAILFRTNTNPKKAGSSQGAGGGGGNFAYEGAGMLVVGHFELNH